MDSYFISSLFETGVCTSEGNVHASIVLAGDPKQLDAVTRSRGATEMGYKTSLMERLFEMPFYQRNPNTDQYNPMYMAQLVKNYRSHSAILAIPNQLFYENRLEVMAPRGTLNVFCFFLKF